MLVPSGQEWITPGHRGDCILDMHDKSRLTKLDKQK